MFGEDAQISARVRVKICGITNAADAEAAIAAGADALGFNAYPKSKRYLDLAAATPWISALPPLVRKVVVLVNPTWEDAQNAAALPFVSALQLHGNETPEFCARLAAHGIRFGKALRALAPDLLAIAAKFSTKTIVLDSATGDLFGGTGEIFPWQIARNFLETHRDLRLVLAGGLTPENVTDAVREIRPFAVDVTTGVESAPGRKDHALLRDFIQAAHAA
ncbi:MAG: phosphoribosylanthranilate isomerase [Chthoniobacterales bacterium]